MGPTASSCALSETSSVPGRTLFRYDVHGERLVEFDEGTASGHWDAYVGDGFVYSARASGPEGTVEIQAFGERIGLVKIPNVALRTTQTFGLGIVPPPPEVLTGLGALALLGLLGWGVRRGALVLVVRRPAFAGTAVFLAITLVIPPVSWGSGGGGVERYWELTDPLGTGMVLLDANGARVRHTLYTPFGAEYTTAGGSSLRRYYAGHRRQEATGLYYMRARWYDPASGTFQSVDPLVVPSDPQSHTGYAYARNNPVNMADPTGMCGLPGGCVPPPPVVLDPLGPPPGIPIMKIQGNRGASEASILTKAGLTPAFQVTPQNAMADAGAPVEAIGYGAAAAAAAEASLASQGKRYADAALNPEFDSNRFDGNTERSGPELGDRFSFKVTTPPLTREQADALNDGQDQAAFAVTTAVAVAVSKVAGPRFGGMASTATGAFLLTQGTDFHPGDSIVFESTIQINGVTDSGYTVVRSNVQLIQGR